jgi:flagellar motor protein MotB
MSWHPPLYQISHRLLVAPIKDIESMPFFQVENFLSKHLSKPQDSKTSSQDSWTKEMTIFMLKLQQKANQLYRRRSVQSNRRIAQISIQTGTVEGLDTMEVQRSRSQLILTIIQLKLHVLQATKWVISRNSAKTKVRKPLEGRIPSNNGDFQPWSECRTTRTIKKNQKWMW